MTAESPTLPSVFPTYGVHNPPEYSPCASPDCLYERGPDEPSDPMYPLYWSAKWTMYRVFNNYQENPPPYDAKPPASLVEGRDYQVSFGHTYYDSTWEGPNGEQGAMMEHYEDWSLPIFPMDNHFTSSFISLGNQGYFLTYDQDRPAGMAPICLFSPLNHPPKRDFIKHLPYSKGDSDRLDGKIQGYSFWTSPEENEPPMQVGVSPDRTADHGIMFGYAFDAEWTADDADPAVPPYRHPNSFYFSGFPGSPPNAPIVSQNYTEFSMIKPDPATTWDLVANALNGAPPPVCELFGPPPALSMAVGEQQAPPTWARDRR